MDTRVNSFEKDGQRYEVRFFDPDSFFDLRDLRETVQSPGVQSWMSSVRNMSHKHYGKWMRERGEEGNFLLAIAGADTTNPQVQRVHGFIYFYPSEKIRGAEEISYARRPSGPSGLMVEAIKVACSQVREKLGEVKVVAEIERDNKASIVVVERVGFVKIRDFDREGNGLWVLDWKRLEV